MKSKQKAKLTNETVADQRLEELSSKFLEFDDFTLEVSQPRYSNPHLHVYTQPRYSNAHRHIYTDTHIHIYNGIYSLHP